MPTDRLEGYIVGAGTLDAYVPTDQIVNAILDYYTGPAGRAVGVLQPGGGVLLPQALPSQQIVPGSVPLPVPPQQPAIPALPQGVPGSLIPTGSSDSYFGTSAELRRLTGIGEPIVYVGAATVPDWARAAMKAARTKRVKVSPEQQIRRLLARLQKEGWKGAARAVIANPILAAIIGAFYPSGIDPAMPTPEEIRRATEEGLGVPMPSTARRRENLSQGVIDNEARERVMRERIRRDWEELGTTLPDSSSPTTSVMERLFEELLGRFLGQQDQTIGDLQRQIEELRQPAQTPEPTPETSPFTRFGQETANEQAQETRTATTPAPATRPAARARKGLMGSLAGGALLGLVGLARRNRRSAVDALPTPFQTPDIERGFQPAGLTLIGTAGVQSSGRQLCEERKQKRGKRSKCLERANVAWTSGPKRGRLAGSKCLRFSRG